MPSKQVYYINSIYSRKLLELSYLSHDPFCVYMQVYLWYPLSLINGGTTAKIMVAAKDNFLGKYIYKDTLARNLAAVIYRVRFNHY